MTTSVVVPTYNGVHKILRVLTALEQQTHQPDEVIVVIDGSTDTTAQLLQERTFTFRAFKVIEQENKGRAAVRNRGAQEATGDLLVFFDDDMRPAPTCLAEHVRHHQLEPESFAVGYQVEDASQLTSDFQLYKEYLSRKWFSPLVDRNSAQMTQENLFFTAANCSMPRMLFLRLGGFDAVLRDIEDFDLGMRAMEAGVPIFFLKKAFAWHDDFVSCASYIKRLREYRRAHEILRQRRPDLYAKYSPGQVKKPEGWKGIAFQCFASPWWQTAIDEKYVRLLPKPVRYKLYDIVTTAQGTYFIE